MLVAIVIGGTSVKSGCGFDINVMWPHVWNFHKQHCLGKHERTAWSILFEAFIIIIYHEVFVINFESTGKLIVMLVLGSTFTLNNTCVYIIILWRDWDGEGMPSACLPCMSSSSPHSLDDVHVIIFHHRFTIVVHYKIMWVKAQLNDCHNGFMHNVSVN